MSGKYTWTMQGALNSSKYVKYLPARLKCSWVILQRRVEFICFSGKNGTQIWKMGSLSECVCVCETKIKPVFETVILKVWGASFGGGAQIYWTDISPLQIYFLCCFFLFCKNYSYKSAEKPLNHYLKVKGDMLSELCPLVGLCIKRSNESRFKYN